MSAVMGLRIRNALRRVGCTVFLLEGGGKIPFTASIQPAIRLQSHDAGPMGIGRRKRAVLYAACNEVTKRMAEGSRVRGTGAVYRVLQTETLYLAGREMYIWAALEKETGSEGDGA